MSEPFPDSVIVPLFPLPGVVLFPGCLMPLRIFEPRYRKMLKDAMAGRRLIAMAHIRSGEQDPPAENSATPPVHEILGVGQVVANEPQPDGTFNIALLGQARCRIEDELPHQPYRVARVAALRDDVPAAPELRARLDRSRTELLAVAQSLISRTLEKSASEELRSLLKQHADPSFIADLLSSMYVHDSRVKQELLETLNVLKRTQMLTAIIAKLLSAIEIKPPSAQYGRDYSLN